MATVLGKDCFRYCPVCQRHTPHEISENNDGSRSYKCEHCENHPIPSKLVRDKD